MKKQSQSQILLCKSAITMKIRPSLLLSLSLSQSIRFVVIEYELGWPIPINWGSRILYKSLWFAKNIEELGLTCLFVGRPPLPIRFLLLWLWAGRDCLCFFLLLLWFVLSILGLFSCLEEVLGSWPFRFDLPNNSWRDSCSGASLSTSLLPK